MWLREDPSVDLLRFPVLVCRALPLFLPTSLQSESALRTVQADTHPFWSKCSHPKHVLSHPFIHKVTRECSPSPSPILSVFPLGFRTTRGVSKMGNTGSYGIGFWHTARTVYPYRGIAGMHR